MVNSKQSHNKFRFLAENLNLHRATLSKVQQPIHLKRLTRRRIILLQLSSKIKRLLRQSTASASCESKNQFNIRQKVMTRTTTTKSTATE